jgi:hypothetical protein
LSGNGIRTEANTATSGSTGPLFATPGAPNSLRNTLPAFPSLWLNELLLVNQTGATNLLGYRHPWAEIYNGTTNPLDLADCHLSDSLTNLTRWTFPAGTTIPSLGFRVVWLDGNPTAITPDELHASFTLSNPDPILVLSQTTAGSNRVLDTLIPASSRPDHSFGSFPDGRIGGRRTFDFPTPGTNNNPAFAPLQVFVNEWQAHNTATLTDPADGDYEDWFELYNPSDRPADLTGLYLGTRFTDPFQSRIPEGYQVPPHGFLLVWADEETSQNATNRSDLHVNFRLSRTGEAIGLFQPDGTVVDFVAFGPQETDQSEGRFPDAGLSILPQAFPTPRLPNQTAVTNRPPRLDPISNAALFEGELLLFSAHATDPDLPPQTLWFNLDPGAPAEAGLNPSTGLFAWRPTAGSAPTRATITIQVTDDGLPPLSHRQTFQVDIRQPPQVSSIQFGAGNAIEFTFDTLPGRRYRVEFKEHLDDWAWTPLDSGTIADSGNLTLIDSSSARPQRFYRISVAP